LEELKIYESLKITLEIDELLLEKLKEDKNK